MGNFMGYSSATELFTAIGNKIKAKQNAISDLETIRSGAAKGATAVQPATMTEALAAKQDSLSETQLAAVNSGINNTKVAQISTNQTNILSVKEYTRRNVLSITDRSFTSGTNNRSAVCEIPPLRGKVVVYFGSLTSTDTDSSACAVGFSDANGTTITTNSIDRGNDVSVTLDLGDSVATSMFIYPGNSWIQSAGDSLEYKNGMVIEKELYDHDPTYTGYSAPNSDLTYLEAEDRAALAEVVDSGAKNEFDYHDRGVNTNLTSFVNNGDGSFTAKNDSQIVAVDISYITVTLKSGITYSLSGTPSGGSNDSYSMDIRTATGGYVAGSDLGDGFEFSVPTTGEYRMCFRFGAGYTIPSAGITFKPMICTKAKSDVSPKFVAYNTMAQWTKVEKEYTSTAADTMEYCGVSFTVPANQIYEFIVMDRFNAGNPKGLGVADNSTNYNSNSTVIAENMADFSVSNPYPWVRQLTGMTVPYSQNTSYYVWVKRGSASKNKVYLMYRRIL